MVTLFAESFKWLIVALLKQGWMLTSKMQQAPCEIEFDASIRILCEHGREKVFGSVWVLSDQLVEELLSVRIIHGPSVVRVHQAEIPNLRSLIEIRNSRRGNF